jgi:hypothetical protein
VKDFLINFLGISYVAKLNAKIESLGFFEKNIWSTSQGSVSHKLSRETSLVFVRYYLECFFHSRGLNSVVENVCS